MVCVCVCVFFFFFFFGGGLGIHRRHFAGNKFYWRVCTPLGRERVPFQFSKSLSVQNSVA